MLSSVRVSREKGIIRAIQGNVVVWSGGECGQPEGGVSKTSTNTTLEHLDYTVVQQYTTQHPLWVVICAWKNEYKGPNQKIER